MLVELTTPLKELVGGKKPGLTALEKGEIVICCRKYPAYIRLYFTFMRKKREASSYKLRI